ncbi:MAG: hypothetical protein BWY71_01326 [Planctomycetes bacterium ADurb.Bin412]|nr:MAG: hypothetical protein BWY71_01326 [Planctomycetes bacterium ADurb.Bin412]
MVQHFRIHTHHAGGRLVQKFQCLFKLTLFIIPPPHTVQCGSRQRIHLQRFPHQPAGPLQIIMLFNHQVAQIVFYIRFLRILPLNFLQQCNRFARSPRPLEINTVFQPHLNILRILFQDRLQQLDGPFRLPQGRINFNLHILHRQRIFLIGSFLKKRNGCLGFSAGNLQFELCLEPPLG